MVVTYASKHIRVSYGLTGWRRSYRTDLVPSESHVWLPEVTNMFLLSEF